MKNKLNKFKTSRVLLACLWVFALFVSTAYALNSWNTGYRVNNGVSNAKVYVAGTSNYRIVTNTSWTNLFVPSKTTDEMNRFCDYKSWTSCYSCTMPGWVNNWGRSNTIDHDTGGSSIGHSQAWCNDWCRDILDWAKDTGQHVCVTRANGRCHLHRDDSVAWGYEAWRSYRVMTCNNVS